MKQQESKYYLYGHEKLGNLWLIARIYFGSRSYKLDRNDKEQLIRLYIEYIPKSPLDLRRLHFKFYGYTDSNGNLESNKLLAEKRVRSVMNCLADEFKKPAKHFGYGDYLVKQTVQSAVFSWESPGPQGIRLKSGPSSNRRVDIYTYHPIRLHTIPRYTVKIGVGNWPNLTFKQAYDVIYRYITIERKHCDAYDLRLRKEVSFAGFISQLFKKGKPPDYTEWELPLKMLNVAKVCYKKQNYLATILFLKKAQNGYEKVHKKWVNYRLDVESGAQYAILTLRITENLAMIAGASFSSAAVFGAKTILQVSGKQLIKYAGWNTVMSMPSRVGNEVGEKVFLNEDFSIMDIVLGGALDFVGCLLGGALSKQFLKIVSRKLNTVIFDNLMLKEITGRQKDFLELKIYSFAKEFLVENVTKVTRNIVFTYVTFYAEKFRKDKKDIECPGFLDVVAIAVIDRLLYKQFKRRAVKLTKDYKSKAKLKKLLESIR